VIWITAGCGCGLDVKAASRDLLKSKALDFSSLMNKLINKQTKAPDTAGVCFCYMWVWDQQVKIVKK
jgi:hypothetical protein